MKSAKPFDIVLFGATGFTGGLVADYLAHCMEREQLRWALAGRDREKLERVRARLKSAQPGLGELPLIAADSHDAASLRAMCEQTRVVITTVGPYARYGEPLVKACAELGTDYVDLTGEPAFVDRMIERYHETAQRSGVKIVHACGFDSVPHDLGAYFTLQRLLARLTEEQRASAAVTIEGFVQAGGTFSGGTWHSLVNAMAEMRDHERERRARAARSTPASARHVGSAPMSLRYRKELGVWALPMPSIDPQIVLRSARTLDEYGPDFRYAHYLGLRHMTSVAGLTFGMGSVFALAQWTPTRKLLLKLKDPGEGPDEETRKRGWFKVTFEGRAGEERVLCEVRGGDPGYGETAKMLAESALCLAFDRAELPPHSGIVTPASGMGALLIARLELAGITFRERD